jgi:hypothetical protein
MYGDLKVTIPENSQNILGIVTINASLEKCSRRTSKRNSSLNGGVAVIDESVSL